MVEWSLLPSAHFEKQGVSVIPLEAGVDAMRLELQEPSSVEVILGHALVPQRVPKDLLFFLTPETRLDGSQY